MKNEIQSNLLKEIISLARKAMVSSPMEHESQHECPKCEDKGCELCQEEVEEEEPDFSSGGIKFVKVKVMKPKVKALAKSIIEGE